MKLPTFPPDNNVNRNRKFHLGLFVLMFIIIPIYRLLGNGNSFLARNTQDCVFTCINSSLVR